MFGLADPFTLPAIGYIQIVPNRTAATLLPIIHSHDQSGTTLPSDCWRAYNNVFSLPNVSAHQSVNHNPQFVDPETGVHTQNIGSYWNRVKIKLKRMREVKEKQLSTNLDEFKWRERITPHFCKKVAFNEVMAGIATQYPVP